MDLLGRLRSSSLSNSQKGEDEMIQNMADEVNASRNKRKSEEEEMIELHSSAFPVPHKTVHNDETHSSSPSISIPGRGRSRSGTEDEGEAEMTHHRNSSSGKRMSASFMSPPNPHSIPLYSNPTSPSHSLSSSPTTPHHNPSMFQKLWSLGESTVMSLTRRREEVEIKGRYEFRVKAIPFVTQSSQSSRNSSSLNSASYTFSIDNDRLKEEATLNPNANPFESIFKKELGLFSGVEDNKDENKEGLEDWNDIPVFPFVVSLEIVALDNPKPGETLKYLFNSQYVTTSPTNSVGMSTSPVNSSLGSSHLYGTFTGLKRLHLETHDFTTIPPEIFKLEHSLQELYLGFNQIKIVPDEIGKLTKLITLHLQHNKIEKCKDGIKNLTHLKSLWMSNNCLASFPHEISHLTSLIGLHLHKNKITKIPKELNALVKLQRLDLSANQIKKIDPNCVSALTSLTKLWLEDNKLVALPHTIGNCTSLEEINLQFNTLTGLPLEIGTLTKMTYLNLAHNELAAIPSTISELKALKHLSLAHNKNISALPLEFSDLISLTRLELTDNKIEALPEDIQKLSNLVVLKAGHNKIASAPNGLASLVSLKELNLERNNIPSIPSDIGNLTLLLELDLARNQLTEVPASIGNLVNLRKLSLNDNKITHLPSSIGNLTSLTILRLHHNEELNELPREFLNLSNLKELSLAHLEINDVHQVVNIHKETDELFKQFFKIAKSAPHHMIVFALAYFAALTQHQERFGKEELISDILHMTLFENSRIKHEATKAISFLSELDDYQMTIYRENAIDILTHIVTDTPEVKTRILALHAIGNLLFEPTIRKEVYKDKGCQLYRDLEKNESEDGDIRGKARRVLTIMGVHDDIKTFDALPSERGVRILALDGGGTRGVTSIQILLKIEERTGKKIHELFDLICGTSTGGILACMFAIKKRTAEECDRMYKELCGKVFSSHDPDATVWSTHWSRLVGSFNMVRNFSYYSAEPFEEILHMDWEGQTLIDTSVTQSKKAFVVSTLVSTFPPVPFIFRNYNFAIEDRLPSRFQGSCRDKVEFAIRCSAAAPGYFDEVIAGDKRHQDGGLIANNPSGLAIHEAKRLWPNKKIDCLVSIGTGKGPTRGGKSGLQGTLQTLIECAASTERMDEILSDVLDDGVYYRFNPEDPTFEVNLDETRKEILEEMQQYTIKYLETPEVSAHFERLLKVLMTDRPNPNEITDEHFNHHD